MARIRSIHPGLFTDEAFMQLTVSAPLAVPLLLGLWGEADDQGVFEWKPLTIKARILPAVPADVAPLLEALVEGRFIRQFEAEGRSYGAIRNFRKWQRPEKPKASHPLPDDMHPYVGLVADQSPADAAPQPSKSPKRAAAEAPQSPTAPLSGDAVSPTRRRPVADQSPNLSAEVGGRMEEVGGKKNPSSSASGPARAKPATGDAAAGLIRLFDEKQDLVYGAQQRQMPAVRDHSTAQRFLDAGLTEAEAGPLFEAVLRRELARGKPAPRSLAYLEQPVADHLAERSKPLPQGQPTGRDADPEGGTVVNYDPAKWLSPELLERRRRIVEGG